MARRGRSIEEVVGDRVRQLRQQRALSQGQLGRRAGVSVSIVNAIEHAKRSTTIGTLERVAKGLGVSAGELLADEGGPAPPSSQERLWRVLAAGLRERGEDGLRAVQRLLQAFDDEVARASIPPTRKRGR